MDDPGNSILARITVDLVKRGYAYGFKTMWKGALKVISRNDLKKRKKVSIRRKLLT